jgi:transposase
MKKSDGRKLTHEQSEYIRKQAVRAVVKGKRSPEEVIKTFGLHRSNIYKWISQYKEGGWKALESKPSTGRIPIVDDKEKKVLSKILMKNPLQLHFDFGLWTLQMVAEIILRKFQKEVSIWTVSRILHEIGYSKQKPLFRAYQQNPEQVQKWIEEEYPAIVEEAKKETREIYFEDEAGFKSTDHKGKTWAKKGKTPIVRVTGTRSSINSISAVSNKGVLRFMLYKGMFNSEQFIEFLKRLMAGHKKKITIIVDGHSSHKSGKVKEFIESTKGKLKIYYLPPYSPELNPDEQVWNNAKTDIAKKLTKQVIGIKDIVKSTLHSIQKNVGLVKSFFQHPDVAYASQN